MKNTQQKRHSIPQYIIPLHAPTATISLQASGEPATNAAKERSRFLYARYSQDCNTKTIKYKSRIKVVSVLMALNADCIRRTNTKI